MLYEWSGKLGKEEVQGTENIGQLPAQYEVGKKITSLIVRYVPSSKSNQIPGP